MGCTKCCPLPSEPDSHWCQVLHGPFAFQVGDEEEILPIKLQNEMLTSLNRHNNNNNIHSKDVSLYMVKHTQAALRRWPESLAKLFS